MSRRAKRNLFIVSILTILTAGTVMFVFSNRVLAGDDYVGKVMVTEENVQRDDCTGSGSGPCLGTREKLCEMVDDYCACIQQSDWTWK